jgi:hypothetical protein
MPATKTIDVKIPHRLTRDEAKCRLQAGAAQLRAQFGPSVAQVQETWQDYHADFRFTAMGQEITGRMDVEDHAIRMSVDVPWVLGMLAEKIRGKVEQEGRKLLEKK